MLIAGIKENFASTSDDETFKQVTYFLQYYKDPEFPGRIGVLTSKEKSQIKDIQNAKAEEHERKMQEINAEAKEKELREQVKKLFDIANMEYKICEDCEGDTADRAAPNRPAQLYQDVPDAKDLRGPEE
jgi:hypothetical protein